MEKCLIITGMHRSHTSYVTQCLHQANLQLGDELIGANEYNQHGHFEDQGIVEFHNKILTNHGLRHRWYGVNRGKLKSFTFSKEEIQEAEKHMSRLRSGGRDFGWKDPRGSLFLNAWQKVFPENHYLFVFRNPVACVNSLLRRSKRNSNFKFHPILAYAMFNYWDVTNRSILEFINKHPERCHLILAMDDMQSDTKSEAVDSKIRKEWGFTIEQIDFTTSYDASLIKSANPPRYLESIYQYRSSTKRIYNDLLQFQDSIN